MKEVGRPPPPSGPVPRPPPPSYSPKKPVAMGHDVSLLKDASKVMKQGASIVGSFVTSSASYLWGSTESKPQKIAEKHHISKEEAEVWGKPDRSFDVELDKGHIKPTSNPLPKTRIEPGSRQQKAVQKMLERLNKRRTAPKQQPKMTDARRAELREKIQKRLEAKRKELDEKG